MEYKRLTDKKQLKKISCYNCKHNQSIICERYCGDGDYFELRTELERLAELEDKIENGTLIELPCKVGDRVYVIADGIWHCQEIWQCRYDICGLFVKTVGIYPYDFEWGETAFLTREDAEKRLKELQNG